MYEASTSPVIRKTLTENYELIIGTTTGSVAVHDLASVISGNPAMENQFLFASAHPITNISASSNSISIIANSSTAIGVSTFYSTNGVRIEYENENLIDLISTVDKSGSPISAVLTSSNKIIVFEISSSFTVKADLQIKKIAFADIKQDGENYIVLTNGNKLEAYNISGALAENYPVNKNSISELRQTPLAVDFEGDTKSDIISSDSDGNVYAFDGGTGKIIDGFPISFGSQLVSNPVLFNYKGQTAFGGINEDQYFVAWIISSVSNTFGWLEENGNRGNTSFLSAAENSNTINEFFPNSRAYNYPNPVYDGQTAIRYFVGEDSKINIKIFDLAGDFVAELNDDAQGGLDNETVWNVNNIQSGVYLARIEASASSGKSESVIVKIAVVK